MSRKNTKIIMPKPCPFCATANMDSLDGEQPGLEVVIMGHGVSWVRCNICSMEGPTVNSKSGDDAVNLWNKRKAS